MSYLQRSASGVYWFRRAVPEPLRAILGRREIKKSLRTKDPAEARRLGLQLAQTIEARLAAARAGDPSPSPEAAGTPAPGSFPGWRPPPNGPLPDEATIRQAVEAFPQAGLASDQAERWRTVVDRADRDRPASP